MFKMVRFVIKSYKEKLKNRISKNENENEKLDKEIEQINYEINELENLLYKIKSADESNVLKLYNEYVINKWQKRKTIKFSWK